jgi:7-cyano-7-deazaguanine synthase
MVLAKRVKRRQSNRVRRPRSSADQSEHLREFESAPSATVLMSGGLDSTVCAHFLSKQGFQVNGVFVDFGQIAAHQERRAVKLLCNELSIPLSQVKTQISKNKFGAGEISGRNAFLLFTALMSRGKSPGLISIGIHGGTNYFDCSELFARNVGRLISEVTDGTVSLSVPLVTWTKRDVFEYARTHQISWNKTYSCEKGSKVSCMECASCRDREALGC